MLFAAREGGRLRYRARSEAEWRDLGVGQTFRVAAMAGGTIRSPEPQ